jgi:hypothetical protein
MSSHRVPAIGLAPCEGSSAQHTCGTAKSSTMSYFMYFNVRRALFWTHVMLHCGSPVDACDAVLRQQIACMRPLRVAARQCPNALV